MLRFALAAGVLLFGLSCQQRTVPNFILLVADDLGYGDLALYNDSGLVLPNLERMAHGGMRFTDFYMAAASCSPARAALLTGQYPQRIGIAGVLMPQSTRGLPKETVTLAELLAQEGYATSAVGKWHLGHLAVHLPNRHGFDSYFGLPYSNDMTPDASKNPNPYARRHPPLPLVEGNTTIETEPEQRYLTRRYTERAVDFIMRQGEQPFFLYLAYAAPHMPLFVSEAFEGASGRGLYSDVLWEIDWSVGQILDAVTRLGVAASTLVLFTSDNGPWLVKGAGSGSAAPLREGKGTTFEGGQRVPLLAWQPGTIPAGAVSHTTTTAMDLMPTFASMAGIDTDSLHFDGHDITPVLQVDPNASTPYDAFFYVAGRSVQAVRSAQWKLHVPHTFRSIRGASLATATHPGAYVRDSIGLSLFDLSADVGESTNVANAHPEVVAHLVQLADSMQAVLGRRP